MLSKELEAALNAQVNAEMYSAYLYLSMAAYLADQDLPGMATWMKAQAQEEMVHAMKIYGYIGEALGRVTLAAIDGPPTEWDSPLAAFQDAFKHEQKVTGLINGLVTLARKEGDHATEIFLQWFVTEQVEEEANADANVKILQRVGGHPQGLLMADREMAARPLLFALPTGGGA